MLRPIRASDCLLRRTMAASGNSIGPAAPPLLHPLRQRPANRVRCVPASRPPQSGCTSDRPRWRCSPTAHPHRLTTLLSCPSAPPRSTRARSSSASRRLPRYVSRSARDRDVCVSLHVRSEPRARLAVGAPTAGTGTGRMTKEEELRGSACAISVHGRLPKHRGAPITPGTGGRQALNSS